MSKIEEEDPEVINQVLGREHLLRSFNSFLDLYVEEGGDLHRTSIADMIKWCCIHCGNKHIEEE